MIRNKTFAAACAGALLSIGAPAGAVPTNDPSPTCADTLGIAVHGQHIIADYVTGLGHDLTWPPSDNNIGQTIAANGGVVIAGGPGPGFHFEFGFAPGASFCNGSQSPGTHL